VNSVPKKGMEREALPYVPHAGCYLIEKHGCHFRWEKHDNS
jgi:hypothetical protein